MAFIKRRRIHHGTIDRTEIILSAVMTGKDIEIACKEYNARVIEMPDHL